MISSAILLNPQPTSSKMSTKAAQFLPGLLLLAAVPVVVAVGSGEGIPACLETCTFQTSTNFTDGSTTTDYCSLGAGTGGPSEWDCSAGCTTQQKSEICDLCAADFTWALPETFPKDFCDDWVHIWYALP
jgi:hypothetical protein